MQSVSTESGDKHSSGSLELKYLKSIFKFLLIFLKCVISILSNRALPSFFQFDNLRFIYYLIIEGILERLLWKTKRI